MITVQIASIPERVESLKRTVESIYPQVDFVFVALNNYEDVPMFLRGDRKIATVCLDNKMTDASKFYNIEERKDYILTLDDDLVIGKTYAADMREAVDRYNCIVSLHGKVYKRPFKNFYAIERNYRCLSGFAEGGYVDVCGSGVMAWNSSFFKIKYEDFKSPNMADIWVSKLAHEQKVKMYVLAHTGQYLTHTRFANCICAEQTKKGHKEETELLKTFL